MRRPDEAPSAVVWVKRGSHWATGPSHHVEKHTIEQDECEMHWFCDGKAGQNCVASVFVKMQARRLAVEDSLAPSCSTRAREERLHWSDQ